MLTALSTALTALSADSTAIDVTGNNLANLNTAGFKASEVSFSDLISQSLDAQGLTQSGTGVAQPITNRIFSQGTMQPSSSPTDVAIQGSGFLVVKTATGAQEYTRGGSLTVAADGTLQTATGEPVQGYSGANTTGALGNIVVPTGALKAAAATQNMGITANLNSAAATATPPSASNVSYTTSVQVYDSLGNAHQVTLDFWHTGANPNTWDYTAVLDGASLPTSGSPAVYTPTSDANAGTLTFDANGNLTKMTQGNSTGTTVYDSTAATPTVTPVPFTFTLNNGAANLSVNFSPFTSSVSNGKTVYTPTLTEYAQTSGVSAQTQDGNAAVEPTSTSIANGGGVMVTYSDGEQIQVGQIALANFVNPQSLIAVGSNNFQVSGLSSNPSIGVPNSGGRGQILGGYTEASTADIAKEFTNLMTYQNSYQAASKIISVGDQVLQSTIQLIQG